MCNNAMNYDVILIEKYTNLIYFYEKMNKKALDFNQGRTS